jgi:hypothetical protein
VSGSRWLVEYNLIHEKLDDIYTWAPKLTVLEGGASGADHAAGSWAGYMQREGADVEWVTYPANWKRYGDKAGPIRNRYMLQDGRPDMVLAFPYPDSRGTRDMISIARQAEGPSVTVIECGVTPPRHTGARKRARSTTP